MHFTYDEVLMNCICNSLLLTERTVYFDVLEKTSAQQKHFLMVIIFIILTSIMIDFLLFPTLDYFNKLIILLQKC